MQILLDLLFPPRCVKCRGRGAWICRGCLAQQRRLPPERCRRCAAPLTGVAVCADCWRDPPDFASVICAFRFDGAIRLAIHQLKYRRARYLAEPLADATLAALDDWTSVVDPEATLVPVPLHAARQATRGYNHAALLARAISRRTGQPVDDTSLSRVRDTPAQVTLPARERWANVRGAFALADGALRGRQVVLVDDVATTTSTLRAAAMTLRRGGADRVDALVVARAFDRPS